MKKINDFGNTNKQSHCFYSLFHYQKDCHQQYLHKNPGGYCGLGGTGVSCPIGLFSKGKKYSEDSTEE